MTRPAIIPPQRDGDEPCPACGAPIPETGPTHGVAVGTERERWTCKPVGDPGYQRVGHNGVEPGEDE